MLSRKKWRLTYKIGKALVNLCFPVSAYFHKDMGTDPNGTITVSLTTYPARVKTVWITVASLLHQTVKPKRVILWLAEEQFPDHKLPKKLTRLEKRGLEIRYCDDLKPHKKYFYTMQEYPDDFVVTADDDIFYPENHLEKLWKGHLRYPDSIICLAYQKIQIKDGAVAPYSAWFVDRKTRNPSMLLLPIGANGVLYPPHCLHTEVFHKENLKATTLYTDDLWLRGMGILQGTPVFTLDTTRLAYFNIVDTMKTGLYKVNNGQNGRNNTSLAAMLTCYPKIREEVLRYTALEAESKK